MFPDAGHKISVDVKFALPGKERQDSVYSGLQVHDISIPRVKAIFKCKKPKASCSTCSSSSIKPKTTLLFCLPPYVLMV